MTVLYSGEMKTFILNATIVTFHTELTSQHCFTFEYHIICHALLKHTHLYILQTISTITSL